MSFDLITMGRIGVDSNRADRGLRSRDGADVREVARRHVDQRRGRGRAARRATRP